MNVFTFSMNVLILDQAAKCRFVVFVCTRVITTIYVTCTELYWLSLN